MTHTTISARRTGDIPGPIRAQLRRIDLRLRAADSMRGLGTVAAIIVLGLVVSEAVDLVWAQPEWVRWIVWAAWTTAACALVIALMARSMLRRTDWLGLAAVAERSQPELGERLTCAVDLLSGRDPAHGSVALIAALADEAADRAGAVDPVHAVPLRASARRFRSRAIVLAVVLLPAIIRPDPFATLLRRALMPWSGLDRAGLFVIDVSPGSRVVALGSDLQISASVRSRLGIGTLPAEARIEWTDLQGVRHQEMMTGESSVLPRAHTFSMVLPCVPGSFAYRVRCGTEVSPLYRISAIEPPAVSAVQALIEPPVYTGLPKTAAKNPALIEAWEGSQVTLTVSTSKPTRSISVEWPDRVAPGEATPKTSVVPLEPLPDIQGGTAQVAAKASGEYTIALEDECGLKNRPEPARRLAVHADAPPAVVWTGADDLEEARLDDVLRAGISARDDVAVASAELHYSVARKNSVSDGTQPEADHVPVLLTGLGTRAARGEAVLGLKALALLPGDTVTYRARVADNRPADVGGAQVAWTPERTLRIVEKASPLLARRQATERKDIQARLDAIKKDSAKNRQETEQLRYAADAALRGNGQWDQERDEALARRESVAHDVVDRLHLLARDLESLPQFQPLARPARQVADVEAEAGRAMLDRARRDSDPAHRLTDLQQADTRLAAVQARLDELQQRFNALARLDDDRQHLRELAEQQDALAAETAQDTGDRAQLDRLQAEQESLRQQLDALAKQSPALKADMLASQAKEAAALAERSHALAEHQRDEARQISKLANQGATLRALADAQRALEDDARRFALEVDPPLTENGRGRVNTSSLTGAIEPIERGELAKARQRLEEGENSLRHLAGDLDDVRNDLKALARRLAHRQDLLMSQTTESLRDAGERKTPEELTALTRRVQPLADRQGALARLAAAIPASEPNAAAVRAAAERVAQAAGDLREGRFQQVQGHQREAREALNRLAEALPDSARKQETARKKMGEARGKSDEIARDLERHLRETGPQPGKPFDARNAAIDLAGRLASLVPRQNDVAASLTTLDVEPSAAPQRDRAAGRARDLAEAIQAARDLAAPLTGATPAQTISNWHTAGPFPLKEKTPLPTDQPVDLKGHYTGKAGTEVVWRAADPAGGDGPINLGKIYSRDNDQAAFGYAELSSPVAGKGRLILGSDDTLTVWLNGKQVYNFDGNRGYESGQARVDVELAEGVNRLLIKCGNTGGEWMFSVALEKPARGKFDPDRARALRDALTHVQTEERASLERLDLKMQRRIPTDDLASELADDQRSLEQLVGQARNPQDRAALAADQQRIASALRGLIVPDASLAQAEAVRLAEHAARALADPKGDARDAVHEATETAETLARRLANALSPQEQVAALARAERGLAEPGGPADPASLARRQHAIADELARLPIEGKERALELLTRAAEMSDRAVRPNAAGPEAPPTTAALAAARTRVARALDALTARPAQPARETQHATAKEESRTPAPDDPEVGLRPSQIANATALARRERQIRERLQAILGDLIGPQEQIRDETAALGRALADLRDRTHESSPRSDGPANAAAHLLGEQIPQAMNQAIEQLAQGRPDGAREAQRRAAALAEQAAQQADDLAAALLAEQPADAATTGKQGNLAKAQDAQRRAARQLSQAREPSSDPDAAQAASTSMQEAAQSLRVAAQPAGEAMPGTDPAHGQPGFAGTAQPGTVTDPHSGPAGVSAADLSALQDAIRRKTGRTWGELPGHLRTEFLQMSQGRYRDDYARLIQLYFREIAAGAVEPGTP